MFMLVSSTGGLLFVFNRNISFLIFALLIIFSLFYMGKKIKKSVYYPSLLTLITILFLFAINFVFATNPQSLTKYTFFGIMAFTTCLTLFYFNNQDNKSAFIKSLHFVLKLLLFHSLFSFLAYFFLKNNLFLITSQYQENLTYNYLFYYSTKEEMVMNFFGLELQRNAGLFWEPGIFQLYLNILFFLEMSVFKRNKLILLLTGFAILSTHSTTGLFIFMIQIIYFLRDRFRKNIILGLFMVILIIPLYSIFTMNMENKIHGDRENSFQKRLFDLTQPFFIALENPLTGVGLDLDQFQKVRQEFYINANLNSILREIGIEQKVETTSKGSSNSVMYLLSGMGFPTAILFIYMLAKQQIMRNNRFAWFIIIFVSVMSQPLLFRPFFLILIVSGFYRYFSRIINHQHKLT